MSSDVSTEVNKFMRGLKKRNAYEVEFHQSVEEVVRSVMPLYLDNQAYRDDQVLERLTEPDRIIIFRVTWEDDDGNFRANRAWRVQFNHALGAYKGGLRFDPSVNQSILKFLGFEQIFKNSLTGLPMGGAKGGSNFNPKGKSDHEVMRFCHSLMSELYRHIGEDVDVPAGDIGVAGREISYLFGQYMRLKNRWAGVLTGKGCSFGGSAVRTEATGYGCIYFCKAMLETAGHEIERKRIAISGSGNVALYAAEKALCEGATVVTLSDSGGTVYIKDGLTDEQLESVKELKVQRRGRISEFVEKFESVEYREGSKPWAVECDIAMPCATQNELDEDDAKTLINSGVEAICEGANMPSTPETATLFRGRKLLYAPGKASNAGGVAVSGLERSQNAMQISWSRDEVDKRLCDIMKEIHGKCAEHGRAGAGDHIDYVDGANIAGFMKVADAMHAYGAV
ncbi:MAG: glutamate dehydrogenase (NADP+) [Verrucomicrobiales bacterium]|jgi:glutamate dehydrogenase (NADP+)